MKIAFDNSFFRELPGFYAHAEAAVPPQPDLLLFNRPLAERLGLDLGDSDDAMLARLFSGAEMPAGSDPIALAYAGHQFGHFANQLGDGRALLLGEVVAPDGARFDLQLKGSGPTVFARNGDGKAAIGPVLREYLVSEAMAALGIPTTRSLAAVATGERVQRERAHPGAVLTRVASSHIRVGTFQFFAAHFGVDHLRPLADYTIRRHFPDAAAAGNPYLAMLDSVIERQCALVAAWLSVGFVHGVMNTDNVAVSGETIDYGPCAFMDGFAIDTLFSSIDAIGRYAYGRQPQILHWNMARFAEALLPAIHAVDPAGVKAAQALVAELPGRFRGHWSGAFRRKLGLSLAGEGDDALIDALIDRLQSHGTDWTLFFRALADWLRGNPAPLEGLLPEAGAMAEWCLQWQDRLDAEPMERRARADTMDRANPLYIPRNHRVEEALAAAEAGDLAPFLSLLDVVRHPFTARTEWSAYAEPPPADNAPYVTYCGT